MTVNLAWRDAMTKAGRQFTTAEQAAGWPQTLRPNQLAALQRPHDYGDSANRKAQWALRDALVADCAAGALDHTTTTERKKVADDRDFAPIQFTRADDWPDAYVVGGVPRAYTRHAQFKDVTHHHVPAPAFAAWLAAQGLEPSIHIAAWFKALGVGAAPTKAPAPEETPAPATPPNILKKAALVGALGSEWPTIEADLKEASRPENADLKAANVRHGMWDADKARAWAIARGKLKQSATVHPLQSPWSGASKVHKMTG